MLLGEMEHTRRMAEPALPVLLVEVVESDRPVRYSLPDGMLSAIVTCVLGGFWLMCMLCVRWMLPSCASLREGKSCRMV